MSKTVPRNPAGDGPDLREAAREAARRAGLTLGQWLEQAIAERASRAGRRPEDLSEDERIGAITVRLAGLGPVDAMQPRRRRADTGTAQAHGRTSSIHLLDAATERLARAREEETLLDMARRIAEFEQPAKPASPVVAQEDSGLGRIAARLVQAEATPAKADTIERVENRLRGLVSLLEEERTSQRLSMAGRNPVESLRLEMSELSRAVAAIAERASGKSVEAAMRDLIARIDTSREIGVSDDALAPIANILADMRETLATSPGTIARAMREEIDALHARIDKLADTSIDRASFMLLRQHVETIARALTDAISRLSTQDALEQNIRLLAARVEDLAAGPRDFAARLIELVEEMGHSISRLDANPALRALEKSIAGLSERERDINPALAGMLVQLRSAIDDMADHPGLQTIQRDMAVLAERTSTMPKRLIDTLTELRHAIERMAANPAIAALEARLAEISARHASVPTNIGESLAEIRLSIERLAANAGLRGDEIPARLDTIEQRIVTLAQKVDDSRPAMEPVVAQIAAVQDTIVARLDRMRDEWPSERIGELLARAEDVRAVLAQPAPGQETSRIEELVTQIAAKVDRVAESTGADPRAIQAIENQVLRIAERLERTGETAETIGALERGMGELFVQVEEARMAAADAQSANVADLIARDISSLRANQDEAEQRTRVTLNAVHETLEKIVDRLAMLEGDVGSIRRKEETAAPRIPEAIAFVTQAAPPQAERAPVEQAAQPMSSRTVVSPQNAAPEILIEPGTGFRPPARQEAVATEPGRQDLAIELDAPRAAQASFIAAARRATQATGSAPKPTRGSARDENSEEGTTGLGEKSRKVLLGLAGAMLLAGVVPAGREAAEFFAQPSPIDTTPNSALQNRQGEPQQEAPAIPAMALPGYAAFQPVADEASDAVVQSDTAQALLAELAQKGNAAAQFELAARYFEGRAVTRDLEQAAHWFRQAAEQKHVPAQYRLGALHERGTGVVRSLSDAAGWYLQAASAGHVRAMHNLGVLRAEGIEGRPDYAGAAVMFRNAAEHGLRDSQFNLAILHVRGLGVVADLVEAYKWFSLAGLQGDADALAKRDEVALRMQPRQLAEARSATETFALRTPDPQANEAAGIETIVPCGACRRAGAQSRRRPDDIHKMSQSSDPFHGDHESIPASALMLGVAGLIPFYGLAIWLGVTPDELLAERLTTGFVFYAASILSFLGGIGWGLAISERDPVQRGLAFGISTVPSLVGWAAAFVNVQNLAFSLGILAAAILLQGIWDWMLSRSGRAPRWFGRLRAGLTLAVLVAIGIAYFMQPQLAGIGGSA